MFPWISSANSARACSALSNTKLDVRNKGTECSRSGETRTCVRIAAVSGCSVLGLTISSLRRRSCGGQDGMAVADGSRTLEHPGDRAVFLHGKLDGSPQRSLVCRARNHEMDVNPGEHGGLAR